MTSCFCLDYWFGDSEDEASIIMKPKSMKKKNRSSKIPSSSNDSSTTWCSDEFWGEQPMDEGWMDISLQDDNANSQKESLDHPIQFINISTIVDDTWKVETATHAEYSPEKLPNVFTDTTLVPPKEEDPKQIQFDRMEFQAPATGNDVPVVTTTSSMQKQISSSLSTLTPFSYDQHPTKTNSMVEIYRDPLTGRKKTKVHDLGNENKIKNRIRLWPRRGAFGSWWKKE
jgi:hypothetical protein